MRTAIFLDVDGVLNCHKTKERFNGFLGIEKRKVRLFKELVDKVNGEIVVSSTWREDDMFLDHLKEELFEQDLEVADVTPQISWNQRGEEITTWLKENPMDRFVILDDEDFAWEKNGLKKYWVCTSDNPQSMWNIMLGLEQKHIDYITENIRQFDVVRKNGEMILTRSPWLDDRFNVSTIENAKYLTTDDVWAVPVGEMTVNEREVLCRESYGERVTDSFHVIVR